MKLEVLISCMHQNDASIVERSNIQSDALIINQCDIDRVDFYEFFNKKGEKCKIRMISTTERGLSRSRNMAMKNAQGDACLICDDDEVMEDDYVEKIVSAFEEYPKEDILAFSLKHPTRKYSSKSYPIGYFRSLRIGSYQIASPKSDLVTSVSFCEKMGSGTGNGGGEENKFLIDCLRHGCKIRYVPKLIASVAQTDSQWFHGYTPKYMCDKGWAARRIMGLFWGYSYILYFVIGKYYIYKKDNGFFDSLIELHKGFFERR
ncbi:glycosyltransferase [Parabacteroides sp.]